MENSLKLIQLKCANCHATLSRANQFETRIKCPYCGSMNEV
ncbi:MAG: Com family DNA-binding transcriptional regulator, partial [Dysgonamonadaceae bacterium]|nr:Com family DNA-binding transcriptional regulator [Dysgonamonadaceae bacterium]